MNTLRKKIPRGDLFREFVNVLNGILQLSEREAEVLSFLLKADSVGNIDNINTKEIRTNIMSVTGISAANLSRYLGVIKSKGLIIRGPNGKWVINDIIRPIVKDGLFELKFVLEVE